MWPRLDDYRALRLALLYEDAYERFVVQTATRLLDAPTRRRIAPLTPEGDDHRGLLEVSLARVEASLTGAERGQLARAGLLGVIEVERAAREFYLRHEDLVHDRDVVRAFRRLAREETEHVRIAEAALLALDRPRPRAARPRLHETARDVPVWGVRDATRGSPREA